MKRTKLNDALQLIHRDAAADRKLRARVERELFNAQVARMIFEARTKAGLTQQQIADLADTTQPVIARLEDADYEEHSLSMLRRIAEALHRRVEVKFVAPRQRLRGLVKAKKAAARR